MTMDNLLLHPPVQPSSWAIQVSPEGNAIFVKTHEPQLPEFSPENCIFHPKNLSKKSKIIFLKAPQAIVNTEHEIAESHLSPRTNQTVVVSKAVIRQPTLKATSSRNLNVWSSASTKNSKSVIATSTLQGKHTAKPYSQLSSGAKSTNMLSTSSKTALKESVPLMRNKELIQPAKHNKKSFAHSSANGTTGKVSSFSMKTGESDARVANESTVNSFAPVFTYNHFNNYYSDSRNNYQQQIPCNYYSSAHQNAYQSFVQGNNPYFYNYNYQRSDPAFNFYPNEHQNAHQSFIQRNNPTSYSYRVQRSSPVQKEPELYISSDTLDLYSNGEAQTCEILCEGYVTHTLRNLSDFGEGFFVSIALLWNSSQDECKNIFENPEWQQSRLEVTSLMENSRVFSKISLFSANEMTIAYLMPTKMEGFSTDMNYYTSLFKYLASRQSFGVFSYERVEGERLRQKAYLYALPAREVLCGDFRIYLKDIFPPVNRRPDMLLMIVLSEGIKA